MAKISEEDIAKVREATDLTALISERVVLKQKGRLFWGNCPFHDEKTPSFKIDPETQLFHCFGCGAGGDAIGYVMRMENAEFPEAINQLAERANIELTLDPSSAARKNVSAQLRAVCADTADFYSRQLRQSTTPLAASARHYFAKRGFDNQVAVEWTLGVAPGNGELVAYLTKKGHSKDSMVGANVAMSSGSGLRDRFFNRVMFPINDVSGRCVAFGGRVIGEGNPKYLNSNENPIFHKSSQLYGIDKAKERMRAVKTALVVEGYTDVIALHSAGITNAVATLGTALTAQHVKLLSRFVNRIIYVFDGDEAGLVAADRAAEFIDTTITSEATSNPVVLDVCVLPSGSDPADVVSRPGGKETFVAALEASRPLIEFAIDRRLGRWDLTRPEERQRAIGDAALVLAPIADTVMASDYAHYIVDRLWAAGVRVEPARIDEAIAQGARAAGKLQRATDTTRQPSAGVGDALLSQSEDIETEPISRFGLEFSSLTMEEKLSQEAIAYMLLSPNARRVFESELDTSRLASSLYSEVADTILKADPQVELSKLVADISSKFPGFQTAISRYDFPNLPIERSAELVDEMVGRINENHLKAQIYKLSSKMKSAEASGENLDQIINQIAQSQKELNDLRTRHHL